MNEIDLFQERTQLEHPAQSDIYNHKFFADAVYSNCFILADRFIQRLDKLDEAQFPTPATREARILLKTAINLIIKSIPTNHPSPQVVYKVLVELNTMVMAIERSQCTMVSWPIACCFEKLWKEIRQGNKGEVFFSLRYNRNYCIKEFSGELTRRLEFIVEESDRLKLGEIPIYCLSLASCEEDNAPLYSNIAHELGHIICRMYSDKINDIKKAKLGALSKQIENYIDQKIKPQREKTSRKAIVEAIIENLINEIVSDVLASILMGHSYLLSLNEMSWSDPGNVWSIGNGGSSGNIDAHPSFSFRISILSSILSFTSEMEKLRKIAEEHKTLTMFNFEQYTNFLLKTDYTKGKLTILSTSEKEKQFLKELFEAFWTDLLSCITAISKQAFYDYRIILKKVAFEVGSWNEIYCLMDRLEHDIPPNVIEDHSMLGKRAPFQSIILAASLYRLTLFSRINSENKEEITKDLVKLDRLASKAIEASFIHMFYSYHKEQELEE